MNSTNNTQQSIFHPLPSGRPGGGFVLASLTIGYKRVVMSGINASIGRGRLTCLIGPNGVGKSTLLRTLAAFQPKLGGNIYVCGKEISGYTQKELSRLVSVVLTSKLDAMNMTVREIVGLGRTPYTGFWGTLGEEDRAIVEQSIGQVGISHLAPRMVGTLSDGERQKMMIAKALAQQTPVILLDEPTAFLDYPSKVETMQLLMRLSREADKTIFMSTHDLELVLQTADTLWLMSRDGGISVGTPRELSENGALSAFIDRRGITFDKRTMAITVERGY